MNKKYNHMLFHAGNCLNTKKPYSRECKRCIQSCPHEAISEKKDISLEKCTECGVCMTVCPSDGLVDRDMKNLGEYLFHSQEVILNCPLAEEKGYEISCLGMLDRDAWTTLMILAESKEIKIMTGNCENCEDKRAAACSGQIYQEIVQVWPNHNQIKNEVFPAQENANESIAKNSPKITRNESSAGLRERGKDKLKSFFPSIEAEEVYPIPKTRQWLAQALKQDLDIKAPFRALVAKTSCTGCEVCVKICPQKALRMEPKADKKRLIYEPLTCVQCGRCVETCQSKALGFDNKSFSNEFLTGKILLIEVEPKYCHQCGKQLFNNNQRGLCIACASKEPDILSRMTKG